MNNAETTLLDLEAQMQDIGLSLMAKKLDEIYRSPSYLGMDKLDLVSEILASEYQDRTTKRLSNRLKIARLIGTPCDISKYVDSTAWQYTHLSSLSSLKPYRGRFEPLYSWCFRQWENLSGESTWHSSLREISRKLQSMR